MILFLHGADTFRAHQKLKEIQEKYQEAYPRALQHVRDFDCTEAKLDEAKSALETISMFERKKLLIFRNVFQESAFEELLSEKKKQLTESEYHVVVVIETGEIKTKSANPLYQWLKKNAKQQEFLPLSPSKVKMWIEQEFQRYNLRATPRAQEELARAGGNNLWQLTQEIRKIASWKKSEPASPVKEAEVAMLVQPKVEADIFGTIDAIAQKNKKQALALLYRHLQKGESPHYLFTMLVYQFRTILQIRDMIERKFSYEIMLQKTKLHPYVLKKGLRVSQGFSAQELRGVYENLFTLDQNLKTGKVEPAGAFDLLVATL
ncbi:MAG TPA: DNA polymerase III subunit delta [Candidatus Paceibacterota bacterium]